MLKQRLSLVIGLVFILLTVSAVSAQPPYYYAWVGADPQCTPTGIVTGSRSFDYNAELGAKIQRVDYVNDVSIFAPEPYDAPIGNGTEDFGTFSQTITSGYPYTWRGTYTLLVEGTAVFRSELSITCRAEFQVSGIKNWYLIQILLNGGFESDIDYWKVDNATSNKAKCNKEGKLPVAYEGECAYQSKSGATSKLSQTLSVSLGSGNDLFLEGWVNAKGAVNTSIKVVMKSTTTKSKTSFDFTDPTTEYIGFSKVLGIVENGLKIKIQIINKGTSGKVRFDALSLLGAADATPLFP